MYHDIFLRGPDVFKRLTKEIGNPLTEYELDQKLKWFVKLKSRGLIKESKEFKNVMNIFSEARKILNK